MPSSPLRSDIDDLEEFIRLLALVPIGDRAEATELEAAVAAARMVVRFIREGDASDELSPNQEFPETEAGNLARQWLALSGPKWAILGKNWGWQRRELICRTIVQLLGYLLKVATAGVLDEALLLAAANLGCAGVADLLEKIRRKIKGE